MALQSDPAASRPRRTAMSPASNVEKAREARKPCWAFRVVRISSRAPLPHVCVLTGGACACTRAGVHTRASSMHAHACAHRGGIGSGARSPLVPKDRGQPGASRHARPPRDKAPTVPAGKSGGKKKKKEFFLLLEQTLGLAGWAQHALEGARTARLCRRLDFRWKATPRPLNNKESIKKSRSQATRQTAGGKRAVFPLTGGHFPPQKPSTASSAPELSAGRPRGRVGPPAGSWRGPKGGAHNSLNIAGGPQLQDASATAGRKRALARPPHCQRDERGQINHRPHPPPGWGIWVYAALCGQARIWDFFLPWFIGATVPPLLFLIRPRALPTRRGLSLGESPKLHPVRASR